MIKNNRIMNLKTTKALGAVLTTSFSSDINYKGQAHARL